MRLVITAGLLLLMCAANAQQSQTFGDYEVHYNAINTSLLPPDVASAYGIQRADTQVLLNISVLRRQADGLPRAVAAHVRGSAVNLNGQLRPLSLREISDQEAIYYIGQMRIRNEDTYNFDLEIIPRDEDARPISLRFQQQFFTGR